MTGVEAPPPDEKRPDEKRPDTGPGSAPETGDDLDVDIRILGPTEITVAGRNVVPRGARATQLLAVLVANLNRVVPVSRIVDILWDDPPGSARQQVQNVVSSLRRGLSAAGGRIALVNTSDGYRLEAPESAVDVFRFEASVRAAAKAEDAGRIEEAVRLLRRALAEWRGAAALSGLNDPHLVTYATLLEDQRLAAREYLARLLLQQGDTVAATAELRSHLAASPFREQTRVLLMIALYQNGRQADALSVYDNGRRLLADELGLDPGPLLREAHRQILRGEVDLTVLLPNRRAATAAEPPQPPVPQDNADTSTRSYLPRDIAEFTGRVDELRTLLSGADRQETNAPVISVIDGMGGVGKTTLAVHLAHQVAHDYPDGQYFINMIGFSAGAEPLSAFDALHLLLRNSGMPPELIPSDLEERSALWRSRLAGRRVLVLLDNAADPTQIRPLLPSTAGALVLISSRRKMAYLEGATPLSLEVMRTEEAIELFGRVLGRARAAAEPEAVAQAVELCGLLPLALQIAAARLRDRTSWSVAYLVDQLRGQQSRNQLLTVDGLSVMQILAWSYQHLSPRQRTLFRLLSLLPGADFDAHAAAALTDLTLAEAETCLTELFEVNLLKESTPGRYHLHDLVRDCSHALRDEQSDPAEIAEATKRVVNYYLKSASQWCAPLTKSFQRIDTDITWEPRFIKPADSTAAAMELLDLEYGNLIAVPRFAAEAGFHAQAWQHTCSLLPYLGRINYAGETEAMFDLARHSAATAGHARGESICLMGLAYIHNTRGMNAEARDLAAQAVEISRRGGNTADEVYQQADIGAMYYGDDDLDAARLCFITALDLAKGIGDRQVQADLANNLGVINRDLGRFADALSYFQQTQALDENASVLHAQAQTLYNIGQVLCLQGRPQEAAAQFEQSLALGRSAGSRRVECFASVGLCATSRAAGDGAAALASGRAALDLARTLKMEDAEGEALNALGDVYVSLGELELAQQVFGQAQTSATSVRYTAKALEGLAHVAMARGDAESARELWSKACETFPAGIGDLAGARRHLDADESVPGATCWRCGVEVAG